MNAKGSLIANDHLLNWNVYNAEPKGRYWVEVLCVGQTETDTALVEYSTTIGELDAILYRMADRLAGRIQADGHGKP